MDEISTQTEAVELLQQLGLKEYEARSFVALSRLPRGTAKEVSEISDVPRTRVYDAIRVLESKGLAEVQHSNPQQFRAVGIDEAVDTLRAEYETRTESLRDALRDIEPATTDEESEVTHEVWALSGGTAIRNRTRQLIDDAEAELILVVGEDSLLTDDVLDRLRAAQSRGVNVIVGTADEGIRERIQTELPEAAVFVSGLEWLNASPLAGDETEIGRLLLADRNTILVSTFHESDDDVGDERAVFGRGFTNGIVAIARRLMATGLLPAEDPR